jgi:hypothetical protein
MTLPCDLAVPRDQLPPHSFNRRTSPLAETSYWSSKRRRRHTDCLRKGGVVRSDDLDAVVPDDVCAYATP